MIFALSNYVRMLPKRNRVFLLLVVAMAVFISIPNVSAPQPLPPGAFYGYVYVDGSPAPDGLNVTVVISGTELNWTTQTRNGTYGWPAKGSSELYIPSDDPETPEKDGGVTGNTIEFFVSGLQLTGQTATFDSGGAIRHDLSRARALTTFTYDPTAPSVQQEITFNASASYDLDEDIASYLWDFGDGNVSSTSDSIISHTFESPQIYNVTLTIIDSEGLDSSLSKMVWVRTPTYISILSDATSIFVGFPIDFTGKLSDTYGNSLKNETVTLYSSAGGNGWTLLGENTTDNLGNYSIAWTPRTIGNFAVKIEWAGNQTFFQTNNVTNIVVLQIPTDISIALSSSTSLIGFKIEIRGSLTSDVGALQNTPILLAYSVTVGQTWNDITLTYTTSDGSYSAVWMPSATGNYLVKATWAGNSTYPRSSTTVSLAVTSSEGKDVFTVESNSTVSDMSFDSTSRRLTFRVSGETGTRGYVRVTIAKRLLANAEELKVRLNGADSDYTLISKDDSWVVYLNYAHSTHDIILFLGETTVPFLETQLGKAIPYLIASVVAAFLAAIYLTRKRRDKESSVPTPKIKSTFQKLLSMRN